MLEEHTACDLNSFSDESDSSETDNLTVGKVIGVECSDNASEDVQFATAFSAPRASSPMFTWEDMTLCRVKGTVC